MGLKLHHNIESVLVNLGKILAALIFFSLSVCEKNTWKLMHISETVGPRVTTFGKAMGVDDPKVDPEGQGHRSKGRVTRAEMVIFS